MYLLVLLVEIDAELKFFYFNNLKKKITDFVESFHLFHSLECLKFLTEISNVPLLSVLREKDLLVGHSLKFQQYYIEPKPR